MCKALWSLEFGSSKNLEHDTTQEYKTLFHLIYKDIEFSKQVLKEKSTLKVSHLIGR